MKRMFTLLSLLAVMLVVGFTSCQKDELVVEEMAEIGLMQVAENPVHLPNHQPGEAATECGSIGTFMYAYKFDPPTSGSVNHQGNLITIDANGTYFNWTATVGIGAVIVKGGSTANAWFYDPAAYADNGLYAPNNSSGQPAGLSHITFCWNPGDEPPCEWVGETAFGGETPGMGSAWWFAFDTEGPAIQKIYAGQMEVEGASVEYDAENDVLTIILGDKMRLQPITEETKVHPRTGVVTVTVNDEQVKVQGYNELPGSRPAAGLFTLYKGRELTIDGNGSRYYVIHLDVEVEVCPETEE